MPKSRGDASGQISCAGRPVMRDRSTRKPPLEGFGVGAMEGSIADGIDCRKSSDSSQQTWCCQGYRERLTCLTIPG